MLLDRQGRREGFKGSLGRREGFKESVEGFVVIKSLCPFTKSLKNQ